MANGSSDVPLGRVFKRFDLLVSVSCFLKTLAGIPFETFVVFFRTSLGFLFDLEKIESISCDMLEDNESS